MTLNLESLLQATLEAGGSDLHLSSAQSVRIRKVHLKEADRRRDSRRLASLEA